MWLRYGHLMDTVANITILVGLGMIVFALIAPGSSSCGPTP